MYSLKKLALASAVSSALALTGCSNSSSGGGAGTPDGETISGIASAPSGAVAQLQQPSVFEIALSFVVPQVAAAITGLEPIKGADVELIRVDDEGNQMGDVLARTSTSITGDYTLTLPAGVDLAGNLIVRIRGANQDLRAQVVEKDVDISPVSEFVLRKFIESGADLDQLVVTDVVKLSGKVEEFDLTAGANLGEMFSVLEREVGAFVETEVATVSAAGADVSLIAGDYANAALAFQLHDDDGGGYGTFAHDMWIGNFKFADGGTGQVNLTYLSEDSVYGNLAGSAIETGSIYYEAELSSGEDPETFPGALNTKGVLSIQGEFEEEIGDASYPYGWRYPATTYVFQQVADKGLFFGLTHEAAVRYGLTDSFDALDPADRRGDEVFRSLEVFSRKPANLSDADVSGTYGRVYFGSRFEPGLLELRTETNTVTFGSGFSVEANAGLAHTITVTGSGVADYADQDMAAETATTLTIGADGTISGDTGGTVGFVSEDASYIDFSESDGSYDPGTPSANFAEFDKTMLVKLPSSAPAVSGKKYRLMMVSSALDGGGTGFMAMFASQFNTFMSMSSNTAGAVTGNISEISKEQGLGSDITASVDKVSAVEFTMTIGGNGAITITVPDTDGSTKLEGFFNEDASLGVFTIGYAETDSPDYNELGLAVMVDVTGN